MNIKFAFFGTPKISTIVLDELKTAGFLPSLIVTGEDKPQGRKMVLTPPEVKVWAQTHGVPYLQLKTLRKPESIEEIKKYGAFDVFVVAAYGKILPQEVLDMPRRGIVNVHPSLLPRLRGASPIKSAILTENETGVTIMQIDAEMDHGPIITQKKIISWQDPNDIPYEEDLENLLGHEGGKMLAHILPDWVEEKIIPIEQDHSKATLCGKIEKADGKLDLSKDAEINLRKIRAFHQWPTAYFFQDGKRIIVKRAHVENNTLVLDRVLPEGKKEMSYADFLKGRK